MSFKKQSWSSSHKIITVSLIELKWIRFMKLFKKYFFLSHQIIVRKNPYPLSILTYSKFWSISSEFKTSHHRSSIIFFKTLPKATNGTFTWQRKDMHNMERHLSNQDYIKNYKNMEIRIEIREKISFHITGIL